MLPAKTEFISVFLGNTLITLYSVKVRSEYVNSTNHYIILQNTKKVNGGAEATILEQLRSLSDWLLNNQLVELSKPLLAAVNTLDEQSYVF
jgi:hypothetical protein